MKNDVVARRHAFLSGSILSAPPCACLKATLGKDKLHITDTEFEFIRINGDMDKEVSVKLDDKRLVVTPYKITLKDN